jgi:hypothetical protein
LEREFVQLYLEKECLSGIKEALERRHCPGVDPGHFEHSRLRARADKIFANAVRQANLLLERAGRKEEMIQLTDRLKKVISRSPVAS